MRASTGWQLLLSLAVLAPLFVACGDNRALPGWEATEIDGEEAYYSGVWGSSGSDIFVVGGVRAGLIYHYNGASWEPMLAPEQTPALIWVFGFGPNDVYAVGERGAFIHYDGERWERLDSNTSKVLWGIWGTGPDDLWLVGGEISRGRPTIRHWNGNESEVFELSTDAYDVDEVHALFKVWGDGSTVYAVGQSGTILRYQGEEWLALDTGETREDFINVAGTPSGEVIAVGGRGNGRLAFIQGDSVEVTSPEGTGGLNAISICEDRILVGGDSDIVGSLEDREVVPEYLATSWVHAIWSDCRGTSVAVGGIFMNPPSDAVCAIEEKPAFLAN